MRRLVVLIVLAIVAIGAFFMWINE